MISDGTRSQTVSNIFSPGLMLGRYLVTSEPCGGLLDCLHVIAIAVGKMAEIAITVDALLYGCLIYWGLTLRAAYRRDDGVRRPKKLYT